jgi:Icc-related predicted phosphoesterase
LSIRKKPSAAGQNPDSLTIVLISDTHELHREIEVPTGDILIHAGDLTMNSRSAEKLIDFNEWLGELPHAHRVVIPGNHDFIVEDASRHALITNATLLINESVEIMGLKFWGSPTTPLLGEAFGVVSDTVRAKLYSGIPADTDILVTHGPPYGILDHTPGSNRHEGCHQLFAAVQTLKPMLHVFGHVHGAYGTYSTGDTLFVNAALPGRGLGMSNRPHVFRLRRRRQRPGSSCPPGSPCTNW